MALLDAAPLRVERRREGAVGLRLEDYLAGEL
jgi:hypothetical protein